MYLVDALGHSGLKYVCCHHEQAAAIAAQAYGMYDDNLGVSLVTTGPGGTNALTAVGAAFMDSTPMLFISGQVKLSDLASVRGVRQYGAQENDIISMVRPVTKYAVMLRRPEDIVFELEKCIYMATHGRKGPVWIDIPLDIQSAEIEPDSLKHYVPETEQNISGALLEESVQKVIELLRCSERPLVLAGHGVNSSGAQEELQKFMELSGIPIMSTWRALNLMGSDEECFLGSPGLQAPRYSNIIIQHCDFLLVLGSRLDNMITAFNEENFARMAKIVVVDVDVNELRKLKMTDLFTVCADVKEFMSLLLAELANKRDLPDLSKWRTRCEKVKKRFPIMQEKQNVSAGVDLYKVSYILSQHTEREDTIVISSTSLCNTAGHIAFKRKRGQKSISSMGFGSMGFALPSAVGAYFAGDGNRVIVLEGDGSFQLNIQELETIKTYGVNAKIFVFDNTGYAAIAKMQERNFDGFYVGCNEQSGVMIPDMKKIAYAYDFPYLSITDNDMIEDVVCRAMEMNGACIVDIKGSLSFEEVPKCISHVDEVTGKRVSADLVNPYPFLPAKDIEAIGKYLIAKEN